MKIRRQRVAAVLVLLPIIAQTFVVRDARRRRVGQISGQSSISTSSLHLGVSADPQFSSGYEDRSCDQDVSTALTAMDTTLTKMKPRNTKSWFRATKNCPELTGNDHKLLFLQSEDFDVQRAAKKLADYWDKRVELFGEKAYLPITLDGALKDDWEALMFGVWRLGGRDLYGRRIVFADPSKHDASVCSIDALARANWYVIHAALEDVQTIREGVVFVNYPARLRFSQLSPKLAKMILGSEYLPVRIKGFHIVNPPKLFTKIVFPIVKAAALLVGQGFHDMLSVHSGSDEEVLTELEVEGIPRSALPKSMPGGTLDTDHLLWLEQRKAMGS